jgi:hypothetical protein
MVGYCNVTCGRCPAAPPAPAIEYVKSWSFDAGAEGWALAHGVRGGASGGQLDVEITGSDPYFVSPGGLNIDANRFTAIRIVVKNGTTARKGQIYFNDGSRWVSRAIALRAQDTQFSEYIFDMKTVPAWRGTIRQLRLDPGEGQLGHFVIDSIGVARNVGETLPDWSYLSDGNLRIGVDGERGAGIGLLSAGADALNVLDHFDEGRFLQQSYYGDHRGGTWMGRPWTFNPVQGGDALGHPSRVLELRNDGTTIYAKTRPKDWGSNNVETASTMEEWITLENGLAKIRFRYTYQGTDSHSVHTQEVPAFFAYRTLENLVYYRGTRPWQRDAVQKVQPIILSGTQPQALSFDESWLAYVDNTGWGVGLYTRDANSGVCYRTGTLDQAGSGATSYFALTKRFALTPNSVHEYTAYAKIGNLEDIRRAFEDLHARGL